MDKIVGFDSDIISKKLIYFQWTDSKSYYYFDIYITSDKIFKNKYYSILKLR